MKRAALVFVSFAVLVSACSLFSLATGSETADLSAYFLPDPAVGLEGLQSYTQILTISFNGTQDGEPVAFEQSYRQDLNRDADTQFTSSTIPDLEGVQRTTISGNVGEAHYVKLDGEDCRVSWGARAEGLQPLVPVYLLPPLLAVHEGVLGEINGMQAKGYTFDAASLGFPSKTMVDGQVWLAEEGGYVVKYAMRIQDEGDLFGEGVTGEQVIEYELNQVNAVEGPPLPEGCLAVLTDFPSMPDAFDTQRLPGVLAYTSSSDLSQIQSFYDQKLQDLGWTRSGEHLLSGDGITLVFLRAADNQIAHITLQDTETVIWVTVKVETIANPLPAFVP